MTTVPRLDGIHAKVVAAYFKLHEFHTALGEFQNGESYACSLTTNENPNLADLRIWPEPFPVELQIMLGEFAHNLRSALDHLAWQLVIDHGGALPDKHTSFPIFLEGFHENGAERKVRIKPGVADDVRAFVQEIQPYKVSPNDPSSHPLGALSLMNNTDKHRMLNIMHGAIVGGSYAISGPHTTVTNAGSFGVVADDGAVIATVPMSQIPDDVRVMVLGTSAVRVEVGGDTFLNLVRNNPGAKDALRSIIDYVVLDCIVPLTQKMKRL